MGFVFVVLFFFLFLYIIPKTDRNNNKKAICVIEKDANRYDCNG
jgi:hypothetical protein